MAKSMFCYGKPQKSILSKIKIHIAQLHIICNNDVEFQIIPK